MAYTDKTILRDINGNPIPQAYNPTTDKFEVLRKPIFSKSTVAKPTQNLMKDDVLLWTDTSQMFIYNGTAWEEMV